MILAALLALFGGLLGDAERMSEVARAEGSCDLVVLRRERERRYVALVRSGSETEREVARRWASFLDISDAVARCGVRL